MPGDFLFRMGGTGEWAKLVQGDSNKLERTGLLLSKGTAAAAITAQGAQRGHWTCLQTLAILLMFMEGSLSASWDSVHGLCRSSTAPSSP